MEISLLSDQGLFIQGKDGSFAINPFDQKDQFDLAGKKPDFILSGQPLREISELDEKGPRLFSWPGEMEMKGIAVASNFQFADKQPEKNSLCFIIHIDKLRVCYLGEIKDAIHSDLVEKIGDVDLLIFPMGNNDKFIHDLVEEVEPKAILPLNSSTQPVSHHAFFSKLGLNTPEISKSIKLNSKSDLGAEKIEVFLLN
ncbi:MAG: MBL fold metallo-hydrolase [Candidatus Altimarinota bacterium]